MVNMRYPYSYILNLLIYIIFLLVNSNYINRVKCQFTKVAKNALDFILGRSETCNSRNLESTISYLLLILLGVGDGLSALLPGPLWHSVTIVVVRLLTLERGPRCQINVGVGPTRIFLVYVCMKFS